MESNTQINQLEPLYVDINPDNPVSEIESLCMHCQKNGITRILLTKIPFFKEIIIMAFQCPECGFKNSEIQPGQQLADQGIRIEVTVSNSKDLNRRVIKSEYATIYCPEIDLEIPPNTQKGKLTTIEGFISTTKEHFEEALNDGIYDEMGQDFLDKINNFVEKIKNALNLKTLPFQFIIDDPAGNSFVENPFAPNTDPYTKIKYYERTKEMCETMGYGIQENIEPQDNQNQEQIKEEDKSDSKKEVLVNTKDEKEKEKIPKYYDNRKNFEVYKSDSKISCHLVDFTKSIEDNDVKGEALKFPTFCFCCNEPGEAYSCVCTIPYFKEIIISSFKCMECGYKYTDVKGGGGISEKATKYTLKVNSWGDLNRDIFKSETASISIPEIEFQTDTGSLGSMFTTIEGILEKVETNIKNMPFSQGDSNEVNLLEKFCEKINDLAKLKSPFTLILDDPLSNSFIFPSSESYDDDKNLIKEEYERTWEQNEELGVNDMKVENYGEC